MMSPSVTIRSARATAARTAGMTMMLEIRPIRALLLRCLHVDTCLPSVRVLLPRKERFLAPPRLAPTGICGMAIRLNRRSGIERLDQPAAHRLDGGLNAVCRTELVQERRDGVLNCGHAHEELGGDVGVVPPVCEQPQHFGFALRKLDVGSPPVAGAESSR